MKFLIIENGFSDQLKPFIDPENGRITLEVRLSDSSKESVCFSFDENSDIDHLIKELQDLKKSLNLF